MYIAKKPCHFQGKLYLIGEVIPEDAIVKTRVSALVKWGMIQVVDGEAPKAAENTASEDVAQTPQDAPESTGEVETEESAAEEEKPLKTGRKGGRKKAGA